jgi:hypothetical protein
MSEPSDREIHWRDYSLNADLYKFYLELAVKVTVAYYAITGAIVSYCVAKRPPADYTRWALLLPLVMSLCLAIIYASSLKSALVLRDDMKSLWEKLPLKTYHDFSPLFFTLIALAVLQVGCAFGLLYLLFRLSA